MRFRFMSRNVVLVIITLAALAVGGAALGLALANRLSGDDVGSVAFLRRVDVGREGERTWSRPGHQAVPFDRPPIRIGRDRFPDHLRDRIVTTRRGTAVIHGLVVARDPDSVLIETSNGERRRVHGVPRAGDELDVGSRATLDVRADAQGRLRYVGKHGARSSSRADARVSSGMVIAIGEVTGVSDDTVSVATILGNNVDIALRESSQVDGVSVGGSVVVMAERTADGLVARWVRPMSQPGGFGERAWLRPAVAS